MQGLNRLYGALSWPSTKMYSSWLQQTDCTARYPQYVCTVDGPEMCFHITQINQTFVMFLVTYITYNWYSKVVFRIDNHMCYSVCVILWWIWCKNVCGNICTENFAAQSCKCILLFAHIKWPSSSCSSLYTMLRYNMSWSNLYLWGREEMLSTSLQIVR